MLYELLTTRFSPSLGFDTRCGCFSIHWDFPWKVRIKCATLASEDQNKSKYLAVTMIRSIPWYYASGRYSLPMPNALNFGFNMGVFLTLFVSICFLPISLFLLGHMNTQRKKKLFPSQKID